MLAPEHLRLQRVISDICRALIAIWTKLARCFFYGSMNRARRKEGHRVIRSLRMALGFGIVVLGLAGCTVGPDFRRPDAPVTGRYTKRLCPRKRRVPMEPRSGSWVAQGFRKIGGHCSIRSRSTG